MVRQRSALPSLQARLFELKQPVRQLASKSLAASHRGSTDSREAEKGFWPAIGSSAVAVAVHVAFVVAVAVAVSAAGVAVVVVEIEVVVGCGLGAALAL